MIALLVGVVVWWWWPAPAKERIARNDEVVAAPEEEKEAESPPEAEPAPVQVKKPSDPVGAGRCALELVLYDADTGAALKGTVRLYRLDAPGNEDWERGDQLQVVVSVPVHGATVEGLPAGSYRPHCTDQRYPGPDHEPFTVSGARTRCSLPVAMPRAHDAWLVVWDERGAEINTGTLRGDNRKFSGRSLDPSWLKARKLRHPDRYALSGGGWGGARGGMRVRKAVATQGRYKLGRYFEDAWERNSRVRWSWRSNGRTEVMVILNLERWKETTFFGISVPLERVHRAVLMPDGGRAIDAGAKFQTWCPAAPEDAGLPIKVSVKAEGYEDLTFEFAPRASIPTYTLVAKAK